MVNLRDASSTSRAGKTTAATERMSEGQHTNFQDDTEELRAAFELACVEGPLERGAYRQSRGCPRLEGRPGVIGTSGDPLAWRRDGLPGPRQLLLPVPLPASPPSLQLSRIPTKDFLRLVAYTAKDFSHRLYLISARLA